MECFELRSTALETCLAWTGMDAQIVCHLSPSVQSIVSERCSTAFIRFRASNTGIRLDSEVVKATCNPVWGNDTSNLSSSLVDSALVKELEKTKPGKEFAVDVPVYPEHIAHQTFEIVFWDKVCLL